MLAAQAAFALYFSVLSAWLQGFSSTEGAPSLRFVISSGSSFEASFPPSAASGRKSLSRRRRAA